MAFCKTFVLQIYERGLQSVGLLGCDGVGPWPTSAEPEGGGNVGAVGAAGGTVGAVGAPGSVGKVGNAGSCVGADCNHLLRSHGSNFIRPTTNPPVILEPPTILARRIQRALCFFRSVSASAFTLSLVM